MTKSHYSWHKGILTIFGECGVAVGDRIYYVEDGQLHAADGDGTAFVWLEETVRMACDAKIAYLGVAPRMALMLVLQGALSRQQLDMARQESDRILYGDVEVRGKRYRLVMLKDPNLAVYAFDVHGNII